MSGFDYCTIIGRDPLLWRWHVDNIIKNAGLSRDRWSFHVIIYRNEGIPATITDELVAICEANDIKYHFHYEDPSQPFIKRLYACWNKIYELGERDLVLRGGSDQAWYKDSFRNILDAFDASPFNCILQAQTVEAHGPSRHIVREFGNSPSTFKEKEWEDFCKEIIRDGLFGPEGCLDIWGHPTITIDGRYRTEGCSWLQDKKLWKQYGPMPDTVMAGGITGDVWLNRRYQDEGISDFLVGDCITYHFVRGESKGQ